jgi:hypothetical protein
VAKLIIQLGLTELLILAESEDRLSQLPSWVLNRNTYQLTTLFATHFHVGSNSTKNVRLGNLFLPGSNSLQLSGFQIGAAKCIGFTPHSSSASDSAPCSRKVETIPEWLVLDAHRSGVLPST